MSTRLAAILCAIATVLSAQAPAPVPQSPGGVVLLLAPSVVFERLGDERPLPPSDFGAAELVVQLTSFAVDELTIRSFKPAAVRSVAPDVAALLAKLEAFSGRLGRGSVNDEVRPILTDLAGTLNGGMVLAQFLRVRVGSKASWNPISGQITSAQSETLLSAALIDPATGTVAWKNQTLIRKVLAPGSKPLRDELTQLYKTLR